MTTPADLARALHGVIEPLQAVAYFAPETRTAYEALGLEPMAQGYVAGRAAPLGPVGQAVATATFFNFSPDLIGLGVPGAWDIASPDEVLAARNGAMEALYTRIDAPTDGLEEATSLAREAAADVDLTGRPLAAGNAALTPPGTPFADLWQALTVLREHRGDGHVALLTVSPLGPVEALVLYASWQDAVSRRFLQATRLWDDDTWRTAADRLRDRGWLDDDGQATEAGQTWRDELEAATDTLATGPYEVLGARRSRRLFDLLLPLAESLAEARVFPRELRLPEPPAI